MSFLHGLSAHVQLQQIILVETLIMQMLVDSKHTLHIVMDYIPTCPGLNSLSWRLLYIEMQHA